MGRHPKMDKIWVLMVINSTFAGRKRTLRWRIRACSDSESTMACERLALLVLFCC